MYAQVNLPFARRAVLSARKGVPRERNGQTEQRTLQVHFTVAGSWLFSWSFSCNLSIHIEFKREPSKYCHCTFVTWEGVSGRGLAQVSVQFVSVGQSLPGSGAGEQSAGRATGALPSSFPESPKGNALAV